jgi:hypothetical protein
MRRLTLTATAAAALVLAAPAAAKELARAELCGPAGCVAVTGEDDLRLVPTGGELTTGPPPVGAFHELVITVGEGPDEHDTNPWTIWYVPSAGVIAAPGEGGAVVFMPVFGEAATFMKALARRVDPYPAPRITAASVGGKRVAGDPASYADLLTVPTAGLPLVEGELVPIELRSESRSPWTNESIVLRYAPDADVLLRGPDHVRLSAAQAADVEAARTFGGGGGRTLLPWLTAAAVVLSLLALAALGALLRRRPAAPGAPEPTTA